MQLKVFTLLALLVAYSSAALVPIPGYRLPVLSSQDTVTQAHAIGAAASSAYVFLVDNLAFEPNVTVYVLGESDWANYSSAPTYGMPNYSQGALYVAGTAGTFWEGMIDMIRKYLPDQMALMNRVYGGADHDVRAAPAGQLAAGGIDLSPFFLLTAFHELGHAFHLQRPAVFPRTWLNEFFCCLCMQAATVELFPNQTEVLTTFPNVYSLLPDDLFKYNSLYDLEILYSNVGPASYAHYMTEFNLMARLVWEGNDGGLGALKRLYNKYIYDDHRLAIELSTDVSATLATEAFKQWPPRWEP